MENFIIKGDICYPLSLNEIRYVPNGFLVCEGKICRGVFDKIPEEYSTFKFVDHSGELVIPGMVDLHTHAPQFAFCGLGTDLELLEWLQKYAFPEETKYADPDYAGRAYKFFVCKLKKSATTRALIFATVHRKSTLLLMDMLEEAGLECFVGKVNMDRNAPDGLRETSAEASISETLGWLEDAAERKYRHIRPILTPRFLPSCTEPLLEGLHRIQERFDLPVQSHLSENLAEVELVKELFPKAEFYGDGYDRFRLFGAGARTVMAHCIHCPESEIERIKENGVFVAHCPASNTNMASGIAPIRRYLSENINVGLGSDTAAGESESIFRAITDTVKVSKLYYRLVDQTKAPLTFEEAFFMATMGGGAFFGKVGTFLNGYEFDALVIDDRGLNTVNSFSMQQRLERAIYFEADKESICEKYAAGKKVF